MFNKLYEFKKIDCIHVITFIVSNEFCKTFTIIMNKKIENFYIERLQKDNKMKKQTKKYDFVNNAKTNNFIRDMKIIIVNN